MSSGSPCGDGGQFHSANQAVKQQLLQHQQQQSHGRKLQSSRILISMASMAISAYFMTSGVLQIAFATFCVSICGVNFSYKNMQGDISWLAAICWITGLMRMLLSVCIGRPSYNRSVWPKPSRHPAFTEQLEALAFLPDVRPQSRDMSVLDRTQLGAGIIHPAYYHRTLLVAWQEGLLTTLWLILHILRLITLPQRYNKETTIAEQRDRFLDQLMCAVGSNFTATPIIEMAVAFKMNITEAVNVLRSPETLNRLAKHTCDYVADSVAKMFHREDIALIAILAVTLLLLPILARIFKLFCNR